MRGELEKKRKGGGEGEERVGGRKERISDRATERERERGEARVGGRKERDEEVEVGVHERDVELGRDEEEAGVYERDEVLGTERGGRDAWGM